MVGVNRGGQRDEGPFDLVLDAPKESPSATLLQRMTQDFHHLTSGQTST